MGKGCCVDPSRNPIPIPNPFAVALDLLLLVVNA